MILQGKTVLVTGVGGGLGRECAAAALRDGANVVIAARTADTLTPPPPSSTRRASGSPRRSPTSPTPTRARHWWTTPGPVRLGGRPDPGGGLRERLGRPPRPPVRRLAQGVRDQRARCPHRAAAGAARHEGGRWGLGRPHRLPVDVPAGAAPERVRRLQGRPPHGHVLPGRRARGRQHPLQHGGPVVDVGAERRDVRQRRPRPTRVSSPPRSSRASSASSPSGG